MKHLLLALAVISQSPSADDSNALNDEGKITLTDANVSIDCSVPSDDISRNFTDKSRCQNLLRDVFTIISDARSGKQVSEKIESIKKQYSQPPTHE